MKKFIRMILTLAMVLSLTTGCVRYNVNMEIGNDKNVTLEIIYAMDLSAFGDLADDSSADSGVNKDDYTYLEEAGYKVTEYTDNKDDKKFTGVKITKTFKNIDDITDSNKLSLDFNDLFDSEDKKAPTDAKFFYKDGSNYAANFIFDLSDEDSEGMDMSAMADTFELVYSVKLPSKSVSNNASQVSEDGKTLTWNLKYGQKNEVNYVFELAKAVSSDSTNTSESNKTLIIGCIAAGVVIVGAVVVILTKKKKETN